MLGQDYINPQPQNPDPRIVRKLILVSSIAAGLQFGWALQLSLLTPYTQLLGLSHKWVSLVWLCGPITGLVVQPITGHYSDRCTSSFGRRRPFILSGAILLCVGVLLIGFAADIGRELGDSLQQGVFRYRSAAIFVLGFWFLDVANNMIQSPSRALLADIAEENNVLVTIGNSIFATFMSIGNLMGYAAGSIEHLHRLFPFAQTQACDQNCANIKSCFLISVTLTLLIVTIVVVFVKEERLGPTYLGCLEDNFNAEEKPPSFLMQIMIAARSTSRPIKILYIVTALNWIGFFPFIMYDTDWMGKEVYGGKPVGEAGEVRLYSEGVRAGAMGLMVYVMTMGVVSLFLEKLLGFLGNVRRLWSGSNFIIVVCMGLTVGTSVVAENDRKDALVARGTSLMAPSLGVKVSCFGVFGLLGVPQAVTYSIPFALASIYSKDSGTGQGLALGLLNLAIVIPQIGVALISGPLDSHFGGSNLPAFVMGGTAAAIAAIFALYLPIPEY